MEKQKNIVKLKKKGRKTCTKVKKRSKTIAISATMIAVVGALFTTKVFAFYDIDALIRRVNQEIQNFASSYKIQADREISEYRKDLESKTQKELKDYEEKLKEQANREIQAEKERQINECEARIKKEAKESNDRINKAREKAEAELKSACNELNR